MERKAIIETFTMQIVESHLGSNTPDVHAVETAEKFANLFIGCDIMLETVGYQDETRSRLVQPQKTILEHLKSRDSTAFQIRDYTVSASKAANSASLEEAFNLFADNAKKHKVMLQSAVKANRSSGRANASKIMNNYQVCVGYTEASPFWRLPCSLLCYNTLPTCPTRA